MRLINQFGDTITGNTDYHRTGTKDDTTFAITMDGRYMRSELTLLAAKRFITKARGVKSNWGEEEV